MRNEQIQQVADVFVGDWTVSITNQRWIEDKAETTAGRAVGEWLGDAFVQLRVWLDGKGDEIFGATAAPSQGDRTGETTMHFEFGRSDVRKRFIALSHDERGVLRVFDLTLDGDTFTLQRGDPDFHQRLVGRVEGSRIVAHPDISEDEGETWIKDFDMIFTRVG